MTLEELKRFAEAAMAFDPYDDAQIEHIIRIFHDTTPKLLEMIAVLKTATVGAYWAEAPKDVDAICSKALGAFIELERSL